MDIQHAASARGPWTKVQAITVKSALPPVPLPRPVPPRRLPPGLHAGARRRHDLLPRRPARAAMRAVAALAACSSCAGASASRDLEVGIEDERIMLDSPGAAPRR